jgi:hypothetical protein
MHYLVVRTDVRKLSPHDLAVTWAEGGLARDERTSPEHRRQTAFADNLESALHLARALATVGAVRGGRQRVKVIRLEPVPRSRVARPSPYRRAPSPSSRAGR